MKKILYLLPLLFMILACGAQPAPTEDVSNMVNATLIAIAQNNPQPPVTQAAPPAQPIATTAAGNCTYGATLVSENPLDGQQFKPSEAFKKTWTFKNSGTCAWDASALMLSMANAPGDTVLSGGQTPAYRMDIYSNPKKTTVAAGETISMVLDMQAPNHAGTFTQNWQIINSANNQNITLTYAAGKTGNNFYVQIVVPGTSNGGVSSGQNPSVKIQQIVTQQGSPQACTTNASYIISAKITGAANALVSYTISSDNNGAIFAPDAAGATIMLDNTGGYDVNFGIQGSFSDPGNVKITITVFVNGQAVNYAIAVICQGGEYKYGTSVAPQVSTLTLSLDILRNATYHSPDWGGFQLSNGIYYRTPPTSQESPEIYTTHLLDTVLYGDINLDGFQDAVVFLSTQNGGSGHFVEMAAVLNLNGSPSNISTLYLGDRVVIESGAIQNGVITLNLRVQGPNDGLCCPSQPVTWSFHLDSGQLVKAP